MGCTFLTFCVYIDTAIIVWDFYYLIVVSKGVVSNRWYSSNIPEDELSCGLVLNAF